MFPLKNRILIRGAAAHVKAGLGIGADYNASYVPFYIPFDGTVQTYWGNEGGNWMRIIRPNGDKIELAHLSEYAVKSGQVKAGQLGGKTGNTGSITSGPHLHVQVIRNGKRLDPETYNWETLTKTFMQITVVNNTDWDLSQKLTTLNDWFRTYSNNRLEVVANTIKTNFTNIPFQDFQGSKAVDVNWYRNNITPLTIGEASLFFVNSEEWKSPGWGMMTYGDSGKPARMEITCTLLDEQHFVARAFHEICHALFFFTGQQDLKPDGTYVVHGYLYQPIPKYKELLDLIDYQALQNKLVTIKNQTNMKLYIDKRTTPPTIIVGFQVDEPKNLIWMGKQTTMNIPLKADGTPDWDHMPYAGQITNL